MNLASRDKAVLTTFALMISLYWAPILFFAFFQDAAYQLYRERNLTPLADFPGFSQTAGLARAYYGARSAALYCLRVDFMLASGAFSVAINLLIFAGTSDSPTLPPLRAAIYKFCLFLFLFLLLVFGFVPFVVEGADLPPGRSLFYVSARGESSSFFITHLYCTLCMIILCQCLLDLKSFFESKDSKHE